MVMVRVPACLRMGERHRYRHRNGRTPKNGCCLHVLAYVCTSNGVHLMPLLRFSLRPHSSAHPSRLYTRAWRAVHW